MLKFKKKENDKDKRCGVVKNNKKLTLEIHERKKRRALYGTRSSSKIHNSSMILKKANTIGVGRSKTFSIDASSEAAQSWKERFIIESESQKKAVFDVLILVLVGYSCFQSLFIVAFNFDEPIQTGFNSPWDYFD